MNTQTTGRLPRPLVAFLLPLLLATSIHAQRPRLEFESGHLETIWALAFSPNGKYLAGAGQGGRIILWDLAAGKQLYSLERHSEWIFTLAFSPDGQLLASGSADGVVKLWNVAEGKEAHEISVPRGNTFVAFSPDGSTLAIACADKIIRLWDVAARKLRRALSGHLSPVSKVVFVDGRRLLSSGTDGTLMLWDLAAARPETVAQYKVRFESFTYGGGLIASATGDSIIVTDLATGKPRFTFARRGLAKLNSLVFVSNKALAYVYGGAVHINPLEANEKTQRYETPGGTSGNGTHAVAVNNATSLLAFSDGDSINLINLATKEVRQLKGGFGLISGVAITPDGKAIFAVVGGQLAEWGDRSDLSLRDGYSTVVRLRKTNGAFFSSAGVIARIGSKEDAAKIKLIDVTGSRPDQFLEGHTGDIQSIAATPAGTTLASSSDDGTVKLWDVRRRVAFKTLNENADLLAFSPDGKLLATVDAAHNIKLWDVKTWGHTLLPARGSIRHILFSPDSKVLAALTWIDNRTIVLWDVTERKHLRTIVVEPKSRRPGKAQEIFGAFANLVDYKTVPGPMAFSKDSSLIACEARDVTTSRFDVKIWKVQTGEELHKLSGHQSTIRSLDFSLNGKVLASGSWDKVIKFWNPNTGDELATLAPVSRQDWVIFTPDGRFDTSMRLEEVERLHWVMPGDALNPLPLDIFMRDYFEPKLLERILAGEALKPVRDISTLNRTQPTVVIKDVRADGAGTAEVTVEVANAVSRKQFDARGRALESGVFDVRLFRDGQLVGNSTAEDALESYARAAGDLESAAELNTAELRLWQQAHQVRLEGDGRVTLVFRNVRLPQDGKIKEVAFSAYAFNNDRVKSSTARKTYALPAAPARSRKGRAYVVTVGVNLYENPDFNLSYAANDARRMEQTLTSRLTATGQYDEVVPVSLISDATTAQTDATKANFRAVLRLLAGKGGLPPGLDKITNAEKLRAATPDDLVLILYAGHGFTGPKGLFYLIPYDTGEGRGEGVTARLRQHSISSDELGLWLRDVDAGHMALIVDACHSAAAVENEEFKPGPLGSRGLGQLAYDKGMLILAATQADNVAHEGKPIRQGLLSYVLVEEGMEEMKADSEPADGVLTLREWLRYGVVGVPRLFDRIVAGKARAFDDIRDVLRDATGRVRASQQPSLFDFARRRGDVALVNSPTRR